MHHQWSFSSFLSPWIVDECFISPNSINRISSININSLPTSCGYQKKSTLAVSSPNISPNINHKKMGNLEFCGTTLGCSPKVNSHGNGKSPCLNCKIHLPNSWMSKNHCHARKSRGDFLNLPRFSSFQRFPNLIVVKDVVLFLHRSGSCLGLGGSSWKDGGSEWNSGGKVVLPGWGPRAFPFWSKACFFK